MATENFFDGAAFGYAVGTSRAPERSSAGSIRNEDHDDLLAQHGHTTGDYRVHLKSKYSLDSAYEFFANDAQCSRVFDD
jgi:hypothetical protein